MLRTEKRFAFLSDEELIKRITVPTVDEKLHKYFFQVKCAPLLRFLSKKLYGSNDIKILTGEFYEFIAGNDWAVLKKWEKKNNASLYSYIARCTTNYFVNKETNEKKRQEREILVSDLEIIEQISPLAEEETVSLPIWKAYDMLNERDREVLRLLVIEENQMLSVAHILWKYVDSKQDISQLSPKRIQGTISMIKHRAQLALMENLEKLQKQSED